MSEWDDKKISSRVVDEPVKLLEELTNAYSDWRKIWLELETLGVFDDAYMADGWEAFCHNHVVYWREDKYQRWTFELNALDFLRDNPPNKECENVLKLFEYAAGLDEEANIWLLFQYIVGIAVSSQSIGLTRMMGISENECIYLGGAICAYGSKPSIVHPYVELLMSFWEPVIP